EPSQPDVQPPTDRRTVQRAAGPGARASPAHVNHGALMATRTPRPGTPRQLTALLLDNTQSYDDVLPPAAISFRTVPLFGQHRYELDSASNPRLGFSVNS